MLLLLVLFSMFLSCAVVRQRAVTQLKRPNTNNMNQTFVAAVLVVKDKLIILELYFIQGACYPVLSKNKLGIHFYRSRAASRCWGTNCHKHRLNQLVTGHTHTGSNPAIFFAKDPLTWGEEEIEKRIVFLCVRWRVVYNSPLILGEWKNLPTPIKYTM